MLPFVFRQFTEGNTSAAVIDSSVIALRLSGEEYHREKPIVFIRKALGQSQASLREAAFWADDAFIQGLHRQEDPCRRFLEAQYYGAISLNAAQDTQWVVASISDPKRPLAERTMMLEAAMRELWDGQGECRDYVLTLKAHVADCCTLTARIDDHLKPTPINRELARMEAKHQKHQKQAERRQAKDHASWILFWREVANNPQTAFSPNRQPAAWNMWQRWSDPARKAVLLDGTDVSSNSISVNQLLTNCVRR